MNYTIHYTVQQVTVLVNYNLYNTACERTSELYTTGLYCTVYSGPFHKRQHFTKCIGPTLIIVGFVLVVAKLITEPALAFPFQGLAPDSLDHKRCEEV